MKLGTLSKHDKRNVITSKKLTRRRQANYDVTVVFLIYKRIGAIQKPDFECVVHDSYFFIRKNLYPNKN